VCLWWWNQRLLITEKTIVYKRGFFGCCCLCWNEASKHVPLEKVTDITYSQGCLERQFGIASIQIQTAGQNGPDGRPELTIVGVRDAHNLRKLVMNVKAEHMARVFGGSTTMVRFVVLWSVVCVSLLAPRQAALALSPDPDDPPPLVVVWFASLRCDVHRVCLLRVARRRTVPRTPAWRLPQKLPLHWSRSRTRCFASSKTCKTSSSACLYRSRRSHQRSPRCRDVALTSAMHSVVFRLLDGWPCNPHCMGCVVSFFFSVCCLASVLCVLPGFGLVLCGVSFRKETNIAHAHICSVVLACVHDVALCDRVYRLSEDLYVQIRSFVKAGRAAIVFVHDTNVLMC